jgi:hypothetical protein
VARPQPDPPPWPVGQAPAVLRAARQVTVQRIMVQAHLPRAIAARLAFHRWNATETGQTANRVIRPGPLAPSVSNDGQ